MRVPVLATDVYSDGATYGAERLRSRLGLLARTGGQLIAPTMHDMPVSVTGVRHIVPEVPVGADADIRGRLISDCVREHVAATKPLFVHCLGLRAAVGALLGGRRPPVVIIEPGVTPAQRLRDENPDWGPERLQDLVSLEDRVLARAHAVIATNSIQAGTLLRRGVAQDRIWMALDGLPTLGWASRLSDMPVLATVIESPSAVDISVLAAALERLRCTWRLLVLYDSDVVSRKDIVAQFGSYLMSRIDIEPLTRRSIHRLETVRLMVCGVRTSRALNAGGFIPASVIWGMAAACPLVAPDMPAIRAHLGHGGEYYEIEDAGQFAALIERYVGDRTVSEALRQRCETQRGRLTWAQSEDLVTTLWAAIANQMTDM